jgi:hypothetical protein
MASPVERCFDRAKTPFTVSIALIRDNPTRQRHFHRRLPPLVTIQTPNVLEVVPVDRCGRLPSQ